MEQKARFCAIYRGGFLVIFLCILFPMFIGCGEKSNKITKVEDLVYTVAAEADVVYDGLYRAGVYCYGISLNDTVVDLEIVLDLDHIWSVRLINVEDSITAMYPLLEPAVGALEEQLVNGVAPEDIVFSEDMKYTQLMVMEAVNAVLEEASIK